MRPDDVILICGKRRSGKSHWLKWYLKKLELGRNRYVVWDYNWEHKPPRTGISTRSLLQITQYFNKGIPHILYQPLKKDIKDFDLFCSTVWQLNNIIIVIEEVERYATSWTIPPHLKLIIDTGRHKGLGLITTSRRVLRLSPDIPFNADHIIIFKQHRPQDLDYLNQFVGDKRIYGIPKLPQFSYAHYRDKDASLNFYHKV